MRVVYSRDAAGGARPKGEAPKHQEGRFLEHKNHLGGIFEAPKAPRKFEKYYFFREKINIQAENLKFLKFFPKFFFKTISLQKIFFCKNFFERFFSKFSENFWKLELKNAGNSISRKKWWVTKTTWRQFFHYQNHLEGKSAKAPPYNISGILPSKTCKGIKTNTTQVMRKV